MRDYGVATVDYRGIITTFVEHTEVESEHGGVIHVSWDCALVGRYDHKAVFVETHVGEIPRKAFENLIMYKVIVKSHKRNGVLHPRIVSVKRDYVAYSHILKFLKHLSAVKRLSCASAVLAAAVKHRHNHGYALWLAVTSRYYAF